MPESTLILCNLGTPAAPTPEAVRAFLDEFLSDPEVVDYPRWFWQPILRGIILRRRPARVARLYESIWTPEGSPLDAGTRKMAAASAARLGAGWAVDVAYRYGEPSVRTALAAAARRGGPVVLVVLFPQRTGATTGTLLELARAEAARAGVAGRFRAVVPAYDDEGYVAALADRTRATLAPLDWTPQRLLLSYHGIPARYSRRENGLYECECVGTSNVLLQALGWPREDAAVCYQSRFGPEKWLTPATDVTLEELPGRGVTRVAVITPGFLTDGLETIEEIGLRGRESFEEHGGTHYARVPAIDDHPAWIASLVRIATAGA